MLESGIVSRYISIKSEGDMMRLTVDIDENDLAEVQRATGLRKKSPAIKKAVEGYLYAVQRRRFLQRVCEGKTDYSLTNAELEWMGTYDSD
jgi:Arc/MetJ family transcription regulator